MDEIFIFFKEFVKSVGACTGEYFDLKNPVKAQRHGVNVNCRQLCEQDPSCNGYARAIHSKDSKHLPCWTYSTGGLRGDGKSDGMMTNNGINVGLECWTKGTKLVTSIIVVNVDIVICLISK